MLLALDIGNSDMVFGWYQNGQWTHQLRHPVNDYVTAGSSLTRYLSEQALRWSDTSQVVISSVVPGITPTMRQTLIRLSGQQPFVLGPEWFEQLDMGIDNTAEIGSDLVANALAGYTRFQTACIVVDFGTALTFTVVSAVGTIMGVSIAPGLGTAMQALSQSTAQLPQVPLILPESAIGKNTPHALQAGIMIGYVGLVKEMLDQISAELAQPVKVVATGGLSQQLTPLKDRFDVIDPLLTLEGIRLIAERFSAR
jgi:type III pantothenate kinase